MNQKKNNSAIEKLIHCMKDVLSNSDRISDVLGSEILMSYIIEETMKAFEEQNGTLADVERDHLVEAFKSYRQGMYYSSAILSGSAVEYRLFSLMSEQIGKEKAELTPGQVIREFMENKMKYEGLLPETHEPFLNYFATNGFFSVFPKKGNEKKPFATLALFLSCYLLFNTNKSQNPEECWSISPST